MSMDAPLVRTAGPAAPERAATLKLGKRRVLTALLVIAAATYTWSIARDPSSDALGALLRPFAAPRPGGVQTIQRREAIAAAAAIASAPALPAYASKKKPTPGAVIENERKAYAGDKGSRGVASASFEKNDNVQRNRDKNGGLAYDANGKKKVIADRNPSPASLGLKEYR